MSICISLFFIEHQLLNNKYKNPHSNNTRRNVDGIIDENVFDAGYDLPLLKCGIHYKPRYGKWKEVIFPARDLKVS